jgi:hypothetical protein
MNPQEAGTVKPYWRIDGEDIYQLQGNSSGFVRFLNALLRHQAIFGGVPEAAIHLNQKDNEPDGGVDAVIDQPIPPGRDPTARFRVPTCWQFKAMPVGNVAAGVKGGQKQALSEEILKPYARRLVAAGYGYRFCLADDMPAEKKQEWESWLLEAARKIRHEPAPPMILTASDMAVWAYPFKAVITGHLRPGRSEYRDLEGWRAEITTYTQQFVPVADWDAAVRDIRRHVDFSLRPPSLLTIQGEAGVGKTRCTYEALAGLPGYEALVLYTADEAAAVEFVHWLAQERGARAVLVADECTVEVRVRLAALQAAHVDRLRIIAIDNTLQRGSGGAGEVRLTRMSDQEVETILERNYPHLPSDRRRGYVHLCRGFVRLAVDMCQHDVDVPADGSVGSLFGFFHDTYLQRRLEVAELDAVRLVSLLPRIGYRDDVAGELAALCAHPMLGLRPPEVVQISQRLRQSPGFIAFGGRYLYVTPQLIAQVAFQSAWERWVAPDPPGFLRALPETLIEPFIARVQGAGSAAMRQVVSDFFLGWAGRLGPPDLGHEDTVLRLVRLVEAQPETMLPLLSGLVEGCPTDELRRIHSGYEAEGARRQLVWLAEKLTHFTEYFWQAERVLLRLALAETESHLGNNASRVWAALFRILLSGDPVPFRDRLQLLEERLRTSDPRQLDLALEALDEILADGPVSRLATPPVVFGRLPPPEWRPADAVERRACRSAALEMVARLAAAGGPVAEGVRRAVVRRLSPLLLEGYLGEARSALGEERLPDALLTALIRELEQFLDVFCKDHRVPTHRPGAAGSADGNGAAQSETEVRTLPRGAGADLERQVREWYHALVPQDLHGRLVSLIGQEPWHQQLQGDRDAWQQAMTALAAELLASPEALSRELPWLCSPEARSAFHLGRDLGTRDREGVLLERMLGDVPVGGGTPLARGYLDGLRRHQPQLLTRANEQIDRLEVSAPRLAYEVLWAAGDQVRQFERLLRMVDSGGIPPEYLRSLQHGIGDRPLAVGELRQALARLRQAAQDGNAAAAHAAVHLLRGYLHRDRRASAAERLRAEPGLLEELEAILRLSFDARGQETTFWMRLLEDLSEVAGDRGVGLAVCALGSEDYNMRALAQQHLVGLARAHPQAVLRELSAAFLSPSTGWRYAINDWSRLLRELPIAAVRAWLESVGVAGARVLARHLEPPHLDEEGVPVVPELTAFVLERFGDDEHVFREFCAGTRSGRVYHGDIAAEFEREADVARRFFGHPLAPVREWARDAVEAARQQAAYWRQRDEEMVGP